MFFGLSSRSLAQEGGIQLASWDIEVWPEYDKPSVLVIYSGTVDEGTSFPQTMSIPAARWSHSQSGRRRRCNGRTVFASVEQ